jgi:protoporphyrinogen oxidase
MGRLMPNPSFKEIIYGAIKENNKSFGYNSTFYYPKSGSISLIPKALNLGNIKTESKVVSINLKKKQVQTENKDVYIYDKLINTIPLPVFISLIEDCPTEIKEVSTKLLHTDVHVLNIGFPSNNFVKSFHWCYFPEEKYKFYRLGVASNVNSKLVPEGYSSCYIEFNSNVFKENNSDYIIEEVLHQLVEIGILKNKNEVVAKKIVHVPYAYVIYSNEYQRSLSVILDFLKSKGITTMGRFGAWEYSYIEKNIKDAMEVSNNISK